MTEVCALSHAESARHIAQTPVFGNAVCLSRVTGSPLGLADQLGDASLAVDQRQVAQVTISSEANNPWRWLRNGMKYWRMPFIG